MKEIIEKARALVEMERPGAVRPLLDIANHAGRVLSEKLNADQDIVTLGTLFMDLKRKQAVEEGRLQDHIIMSLKATKDFLEQFDLDEKTKNKIYNCVEAHHGNIPYTCLEAEIVANADCYKFLHPKGMIIFMGLLNKRGKDVIKNAEAKLEEKHDILSLDICKEELEPYYKMFKELFKKARE
jgi:hypothetical protein